jgi:hypothetical protein
LRSVEHIEGVGDLALVVAPIQIDECGDGANFGIRGIRGVRGGLLGGCVFRLRFRRARRCGGSESYECDER